MKLADFLWKYAKWLRPILPFFYPGHTSPDSKPEPFVPDPEPPVTPPVVEPPKPSEPKPNKGGDGLYKPYEYEDGKISSRSKMWMLPQGIRAEHVARAGEYRPDGTLVDHFVWPNSKQPFPLNSQPIDGNHIAWEGVPGDYYHPESVGRLKCRQAKADAKGNIFRAFGMDGKVLAEMTIVDPEVRQEGKS